MCRWRMIFGLMVLCLTASGCTGRSTTGEPDSIDMFYLNKEITKVSREEFAQTGMTTKELLTELMEALQENPKSVDLKAPISGFGILSYKLDKEQVIINLDEQYKNMTPIKEVLTRAAIVRTLTQIPGIEYVSMMVNGVPLTDSAGNPVGTMKADMFIDNVGAEISAYEKATVKLYFANEAGNQLVGVQRSVVYNSNVSTERIVVEELIKGPAGSTAYPLINPATKLISITVKDGVCYVNLSEDFLTQSYSVSADVSVYAIVNSLAELSNINKVQISINGKTNIMYLEKINLESILERDLQLVEGG